MIIENFESCTEGLKLGTADHLRGIIFEFEFIKSICCKCIQNAFSDTDLLDLYLTLNTFESYNTFSQVLTVYSNKPVFGARTVSGYVVNISVHQT